MKILLITFDPPQNVGGVEGRGNNYTRRLVELGHFVEVISFSAGEGNDNKHENDTGQKHEGEEEYLHGARLLKLPSSTSQVLKTLRRTRNEILNESFDSVFFLSGALTLFGVLLLLYTKYKHIRSVVFFYGKDILTSRKLSFFSGSIALRLSPRLGDVIAVNSHYTEGLLPSKFKEKIRILYPSVDSKIVALVDDIMNRNSTLVTALDHTGNSVASSEKPGIILFVGRLVKRKGADDLLRAFHLLISRLPSSRPSSGSLASTRPSIILEIVGDGPELPNLEQLARDLGIEDRVRFYGRLSGKPLYARYGACNVFVMPSKTTDTDVEGFGTVFLEAAAFGKPSVGTRSGGIPEAIQDGVTGLLVPEGDIDRLAEALESLLSNHELARSLGENARELVLSEFTWEKSTDLLVSLLKAPSHTSS